MAARGWRGQRIPDKGPRWHGAIFTSFQRRRLTARVPVLALRSSSSEDTIRGEPSSNGSDLPTHPATHQRSLPGVTIATDRGSVPEALRHLGRRLPEAQDRVFLFAGFNPEFQPYSAFALWPNAGWCRFSQNTHTDYATPARCGGDSRFVYSAPWLAQDQKQWGESLPVSIRFRVIQRIPDVRSGAYSYLQPGQLH